MSLTDCIKKAGKNISAQDAEALRTAVVEGATENEAIDQVLGGIDGELGEIAQGVEETGGAVTRRVAEQIAGAKLTPAEQKASISMSQRQYQQRIAEAYNALPVNDLENPLVQRAYSELAAETLNQYQAMTDAGIQIELMEGEGEPYANSDEMRQDIEENNHLYVFATEGAFGPEGETFEGHPLLQESGLVDINGTPMLFNDAFRAIHDYFSHTMSRTTFGPLGEEAAWRNHMMMIKSPWARWALTTETRGQNSYVNFSPGRQELPITEREFAPQKVGLLPLGYVLTGGDSDIEIYNLAREIRDADIERNNERVAQGDERVDTPPVETIRLTHWSRRAGIEELTPERYGEGLTGSENKRKKNDPGNWVDRTYYGVDVGGNKGYVKEAGLGNTRYVVDMPMSVFYDWDGDSDNFHDAAIAESEETGGTVASIQERMIHGAGYLGYHTLHPSLGRTAASFTTLTPDHEIDDTTGKILLQETRASIQFTEDQESIIRLTRASDLSSFLHESAHLFLETEKRFAEKFGVTEDMQTLFDWLGIDSFDQLTVEHHEKFAETFEVYLREGKAPSLKLRDAFAAFRRWLTRIYQSLGLQDPRLTRADINPEIREYMDRMLATDAEIEQATANPAYDQYFRSQEQAGMSDEQWAKYQSQVLKATNKATMELDQQVIDEYRKRKTKEWKEERSSLIDEELEELVQTPVYEIMDMAQLEPMDRELFKSIGNLDKIPSKLRGMTITDGTGIDPEVYSDTYGFTSVSEMIDELIEAPTLKKAAFDAAEARMINKYGDMLNDGRIELEAREAIHNEEQAKLLLMELKALNKKAPTVNREYLKAEAKRLIGTMKYKEIKPNKYYRAEIKAAQTAVTADTDEARIAAKTQQLVNHYMYKEAVDTKKSMDAQRRRIKRVQTREYKASEVAPDFSQNMRTLANLYDLRNQPDQVRDVRQILEWYDAQIADVNSYVDITMLDVNLVLAMEARDRGELAQLQLPAFDDLTADELRGLDDMLKHLRYVGGKLADVTKAKLAADRQELSESIIESGGKDIKVTRGVPRKHERVRRQISHMINKIPSLRNLVRKLDGFEEDGVAARMIYRTIEDANSNKIKLARQIYEKFETEMSAIHTVGLDRTNTKDYTLEDGTTLTMHPESRYMMALYWGTESSRQALRDGFGVTDTDVRRILSDMTQEQLELVNATWNVNEHMWPELSKAHVELYGTAPPKLDPTPYEINGVRLTGGHMRLFYDSTELELKGIQEEAGAMASIMPTKAGSLNARVGSGGRPPKLDKNNITRAIEDNVHYIAFAEVSNNIRSIINAKEVKAAIEIKHGPGFYGALLEAIDGVTGNHQERSTVPAMSAMFRLLRRAAVFKHLAYSLRNTVQQVSAIPVAMEEVGVIDWFNHMMRFASPVHHAEMVDFVTERSKFMQDRASFVNREASEYLRKITTSSKTEHLWGQFARFGFTPQTIVDSIVAFPTWMARYEQGMNDHGEEARAVSDADTAVAESVGSGSDLHLGGIFQSNNTEFVRMFTVFGTWFNAYYQRIYKSTQGMSTMTNMDAARSVLMTPFIVAAMEAIITMKFPEDDEKTWAWLLKRYGSFMAGTVPILRDIVGSFSGFAPKTVFSGGAETPVRFLNELKAYTEGRQTMLKTVSDITKVTTTIVPVPGVGNMTRLMDYVDSHNRGKEADFNAYQAIIKGPTR